MFRQEYLNARGHELVQRAHSDPTDDHAIKLFAGERLERLAHAMTMMHVRICDRPATATLGVGNKEERRRSEVGADGTLESLVLGDWNTDVHLCFFLCWRLKRLVNIVGLGPVSILQPWSAYLGRCSQNQVGCMFELSAVRF